MDVVKIILSDVDPTQVIDNIKANSLAMKIKDKVENTHGIVFNEHKLIHALATNSTFGGAVCTIQELLPGGHLDQELGKDDNIYDMFSLSSNDRRQMGSVHAARAITAGTNVSLAQRGICQAAKQDTKNESEKWGGDSSDEDIPEQYRNRLREQWHQFRIMSFPYFKENRRGRCLFGTLVVFTFVNSGINVYFSYLIRDFSTALAEKHVQDFYNVMLKFVISMIALIPLQVSFRFIRVQLAIGWRKWLTERVLKLYFSNKVSRKIACNLSLSSYNICNLHVMLTYTLEIGLLWARKTVES